MKKIVSLNNLQDATRRKKLLARQAADASSVMKLLANKNRLIILCYLMMQKEMKVGDLVTEMGLGQSAMSQHLMKLRDKGLVTFRRHSQSLYYRIEDHRISKLINVLKSLYCEDIA